MKRWIWTLFLLCPLVWGQSTNVTGTLVDQTGVVWANASVSATFQPAVGIPGPYIWSGGTLNQQPTPVVSNGSGIFSISLPSNTSIVPNGSSWLFVITPNASRPAVVLGFAISGASTDISSAFAAAATNVSIQSMSVPRAYSNSMMAIPPNVGQLYYDTVSKGLKYFENGVWNLITGGPSGGVSSITIAVPAWAGVTGNPCTVTTTGTCTITLPAFLGSGVGHAAGIVPDPGGIVGITKFLREDGTWSVPSGGGGGGITCATVGAQAYWNGTALVCDVNFKTDGSGNVTFVTATGTDTTKNGSYTSNQSATGDVYGAAPAAHGVTYTVCADKPCANYPSNTKYTFPVIVAQGTTALHTASIVGGGCDVTTATATGASVSTDVIMASTTGSISALTGYVPSTAGGLSYNQYITANTVNWEVCNYTSVGIIPGAVSVAWKVIR